MSSDENIRITAEELRKRMSAGEQFTIIDARNPQAWGGATDKARTAVRIEAHSNQPLPQLQRDKAVVVYCT